MKIRKLLICAVVVCAASLALISCAAPEARLSDRGLSPKDRREYISQNGFGLPKEVQQAFVEGRLVEGMSRDMVQRLFGLPDRTADDDATWEYVNKRGEDVVGIHFKRENVFQIYGDPFGRTRKRK